MRLVLVIATFLSVPLAAPGQTAPPAAFTPQDAKGVDLSQFLWKNRVVVVFADSPADPAFVEQIERLGQEPDELASRDIVVITDSAPADASAMRQKLRPRGFSLVWIDKDGQVRLRKPNPWSVRELTHAIDKTPLRLQELQERKAGG